MMEFRHWGTPHNSCQWFSQSGTPSICVQVGNNLSKTLLCYEACKFLTLTSITTEFVEWRQQEKGRKDPLSTIVCVSVKGLHKTDSISFIKPIGVGCFQLKFAALVK